MPLRENIVGITNDGHMPSFISVNRTDEGRIAITVRGEARPEQAFGDTATIVLTADTWARIVAIFVADLAAHKAPGA